VNRAGVGGSVIAIVAHLEWVNLTNQFEHKTNTAVVLTTVAGRTLAIVTYGRGDTNE
jgi:hypothetical protein